MQNDELLSWYGVAPSLNAYITFEVFLTKEEQIGAERTTSMRYRDMMVDNYLAGGGDLKTWKYIGVERIVHRGTRIMIEGYFHQDSNLFSAGGALELRPSDSEFACMALKNPFTRGIQRLLREYESEVANARIRRVIFISMGVVNDFSLHPESNPMLNMVVELCRPGEDGYPDC
ncbi:hypothetical protein SAMD00023353_0500930 [Rosellinia necatrix]|uniref:Uncharacterized protein n=1 Tax=Rosellinia necatrix TaxID=77044 RepID=A0A1S7UKA0_ROSNE|nr:hypothetical protein SAMD00023353_0500930 [Rosellinia necatrix]